MNIKDEALGWKLAAYGMVIRGDENTSEDQVGSALSSELAQRMVACWNVCEGISTEVLELNATAGGVATLESQRNEAAGIALELVAQRDELLAALEGMLGKAYKQNWNDQYPDEIAAAEHVIAKAKGGAQ